MCIFYKKIDLRCESVSFSSNPNLENYSRKAIIHLTSRQVQFQKPYSLPQAKQSTASQDELQRKYCISFIYCVLFQETITIWAKKGRGWRGVSTEERETWRSGMQVALALAKKLRLVQVNYRA